MLRHREAMLRTQSAGTPASLKSMKKGGVFRPSYFARSGLSDFSSGGTKMPSLRISLPSNCRLVLRRV